MVECKKVVFTWRSELSHCSDSMSLSVLPSNILWMWWLKHSEGGEAIKDPIYPTLGRNKHLNHCNAKFNTISAQSSTLTSNPECMFAYEPIGFLSENCSALNHMVKRNHVIAAILYGLDYGTFLASARFRCEPYMLKFMGSLCCSAFHAYRTQGNCSHMNGVWRYSGSHACNSGCSPRIGHWSFIDENNCHFFNHSQEKH